MNAPVKFAGMPDGPKLFVKELGQEVPTFTQEPGGKLPALEYHVPLKLRGPYRPEQLANFNPEVEYRCDALGYVLCGGYTNAGEKCSKRAENRAGRCNQHGGRIHPLDKLVKDNQEPANKAEAQSLSRYRQFLAGQITVDDLDDEELATCGFRAVNGRIYKPRNVPRDMATAFTKAIYERAQQGLKAHTVTAAHTVAEIMLDKTVEPDIRLKAANTLLDRGLGKAPQQINMTHEITGFEAVFEGIFSGPRDQRPEVIDGEFTTSEPVDIGRDSDRPIDGFETEQLSIGSSGDSVVAEQDSTGAEPGQRDARLFARNEAILAQTVEIKPFEYDLSDKSEAIKKATQKRYASRALGVDLTGPNIPYIRQRLDNGLYRHVLSDEVKVKAPQSNSKAQARKKFTLSDFS